MSIGPGNVVRRNMRLALASANWLQMRLAQLDTAVLEMEQENAALRAENRKLRDVLEWTNVQCPGKCAGVCDAALSGEHREEKP